MKFIILLSAAALIFCSCNNKAQGDKPFCDTTCKSDKITFDGDAVNKQSVIITIDGCKPDSLTWTHRKAGMTRQVSLSDFLNRQVRLNRSAINVAFQDTSLVWLSFNDCITGRGYLLKLPYNKSKTIQKISGALNSFDHKFVVDDDLRAYTDEGNIYVDNVKTGKGTMMTFKKKYPIDFYHIHDVVDSINVTKSRIFVRLRENNQNVDFEKNIGL